MDNTTVCRKIARQIKKDLTDIIDIGIEIKTQTTVGKGQNHEATTYTGLITSTTKTQIYTGTFTAHTWYKPIIQNKYITIDEILIPRSHIEINYTQVKPNEAKP